MVESEGPTARDARSSMMRAPATPATIARWFCPREQGFKRW